MGLDPGMGMLHADQRNRASLTLDVIEPVRPQVDALVLAMLRTKVFTLKDFFETREGNCRLMPAITKALGEQAPAMTRWVGASSRKFGERVVWGGVDGQVRTFTNSADQGQLQRRTRQHSRRSAQNAKSRFDAAGRLQRLRRDSRRCEPRLLLRLQRGARTGTGPASTWARR